MQSGSDLLELDRDDGRDAPEVRVPREEAVVRFGGGERDENVNERGLGSAAREREARPGKSRSRPRNRREGRSRGPLARLIGGRSSDRCGRRAASGLRASSRNGPPSGLPRGVLRGCRGSFSCIKHMEAMHRMQPEGEEQAAWTEPGAPRRLLSGWASRPEAPGQAGTGISPPGAGAGPSSFWVTVAGAVGFGGSGFTGGRFATSCPVMRLMIA